eukprot:9012979-Alexandrium_andersonii.AAC.1
MPALSRASSFASLVTVEGARLREASWASRGARIAPPRITLSFLHNFPPSVRKQMLGEQLHPLVEAIEPQRAGKITG